MRKPRLRGLALIGSAGVVLTVGMAPILTRGADHLDAPNLGSLSAGAVKGDRDINDVYVFGGSDSSRTVLAMTTNPAVNVPAIDPFGHFGSDVRYTFNIDRTGDARPDLAYVVTFDSPDGAGNQAYTVTRYEGGNARTLNHGVSRGSGSTAGTGIGSLKGNGTVFAGVRSDPFFFDLIAFRNTLGIDNGTRTFCQSAPGVNDATGIDFFAGLNALAIVLEVPTDQLGGTQIGVWATTSQLVGDTWVQQDQMGRPAINTVFNHTGADKNAFNVTDPADQRTSGPFRQNIITTLIGPNTVFGPFATFPMGISGLAGSPYSAAQAGGIADLLLPDVLTYDTTQPAAFLNGRALADDVIDAELGIVTKGVVPSDCVAAHTDYQGVFPYLGSPHP